MLRQPDRLDGERFDVAVVGGGIHGAWIARRAAAAGYRVALIEKGDFGAATSANSLKILHGGLRYLQHLDFARMRSSIRARREFLRAYPHLTQPLPCVMPLQSTGVRSPWFLWPALLLNDLVSADRNAGVSAANRLPAGRILPAGVCRTELRSLVDSAAVAGARWWDGLAVDSFRLVLEPLLQAAADGAVICNHIEAVDYLSQGTVVTGVNAVDRLRDRPITIRAAVVIDAAGPWAGRWAQSTSVSSTCLPRGWLHGMNLVLRRSLGIPAAVALSSARSVVDRSAVLKRASRELFFVPWAGTTMVGTHYHRLPDAHASAGPPDEVVRDFLADINSAAPKAGIGPEDIAHIHWGLLPADSADSQLPSKSPVLLADRGATGLENLLVVIGEKLTSAPELSGRVLAHARAALERQGVARPAARPRPGVPERAAGVGDTIATMAPSASFELRVAHAVRNEMALTLDDILYRRLGLAESGRLDPALVAQCAALAAAELGWSDSDRAAALQAFLRDQAGSGCR